MVRWKRCDGCSEGICENEWNENVGRTARGKFLTAINKEMAKILGRDKAYKIMKPLWEKTSASFAKGANGEVHVFLKGGIINDTSIFARIEKPIIDGKKLNIINHVVNWRSE